MVHEVNYSNPNNDELMKNTFIQLHSYHNVVCVD